MDIEIQIAQELKKKEELQRKKELAEQQLKKKVKNLEMLYQKAERIEVDQLKALLDKKEMTLKDLITFMETHPEFPRDRPERIL